MTLDEVEKYLTDCLDAGDPVIQRAWKWFLKFPRAIWVTFVMIAGVIVLSPWLIVGAVVKYRKTKGK